MRAIITCLIVFLMSGCAGIQTQLQRVQDGAKAASTLNEGYFLPKCESIARQCKTDGDTVCAPWETCINRFKMANQIIKSVHVTVLTSASLLALDEDKKAQTYLIKATEQLRQAYDLLKQYGVL